MYCVKSVHIRSYSGLRFSRIRTEYGAYLSVFSPNAGKMQTRITPNADAFYAVMNTSFYSIGPLVKQLSIS